jgi:hypothetical protein
MPESGSALAPAVASAWKRRDFIAYDSDRRRLKANLRRIHRRDATLG